MKSLNSLPIPASVAIAIGLCAASCSTQTVAPAPVQAAQVSDWAHRNILDADATGLVVTPEYVRAYQVMLSAEGDKLPVSNRPGSPADGISPCVWKGQPEVHVTYEVGDRFEDLKYYERNSSP